MSYGKLAQNRKNADAQSDSLRALVRDTFEKNRLEDLLILITYGESWVELWASIHLLPIATVECVKKLKELEVNETILGLEARRALKSRKNGTMKFLYNK